jgi:hypothetical protein
VIQVGDQRMYSYIHTYIQYYMLRVR